MNPGTDAPDADQPAWIPTPEFIETTNLAWLMRRAGVRDYPALHRWSVEHRDTYWSVAIERLGLCFREPFREIVDLSGGIEKPRWLPGARWNIVESCFAAPPGARAILHQSEGQALRSLTYGELQALTAKVAANLRRIGLRPGDVVGVLLPMTPECVAIYLGIIAMGGIVAGIAESFRPKEIALRLQLAKAVLIFSQTDFLRGGKAVPLQAHLVEAEGPRAIVLSAGSGGEAQLRPGDCTWEEFLVSNGPLELEVGDAERPINILFSSGTTGEPKVIPWTQTTPIKCAADAHFHQNIQADDVLAWPTSIGWMMGPWLIFASLINQAAMALYDGAPTGREFGKFIQDSKTTMLGVVPSLVKAWRRSGCLDGVDWRAIRVFSSTGECSNAGDMRWLMARAGGRPVVEYCGGTEIGGAYITAAVTQPCVAGTFNTPTLGLDFVILNERGEPAESGELFLLPPSIGLSTMLLNRDHHEIYFAGTPPGPQGKTLRRHGDEMERLPDGSWRAHGRADDTMNLGGIKVSSAEIERVLQTVPGVVETAAIAVAPEGGPSELVIYAVGAESSFTDPSELRAALQAAIKRDLNPLFKIHDLVIVPALPRTASNKVLRRELRARSESRGEATALAKK